MSLRRDLIHKANGQGRGDMSAQFGIDAARRLVHRADVLRLPVNPVELKAARAIVRAAAAAADQDTSCRVPSQLPVPSHGLGR